MRLLIVDDHPILCEGLRALLRYYSDLEVVGEARSGQEALAQADALRPDIVLMDLAMPDMNGIEATRLIRQRHPDIRILVLSQHEERQYLIPALRAGASGYLPKRALGSDLLTALRAVARGETYVYPPLASVLVEELQCEPLGAERESLTRREREILRHIVDGKTNVEMAVELGLSVKTVEWHRTNLMSKLGVHNVAELVRYALEHGLVEEGAQDSLSPHS